MSAFAAHVREGRNHMLWQFMLNIEIVLLNIRPSTLSIDGVESQRESQNLTTPGTDICVARNVRLRWIQY